MDLNKKIKLKNEEIDKLIDDYYKLLDNEKSLKLKTNELDKQIKRLEQENELKISNIEKLNNNTISDV